MTNDEHFRKAMALLEADRGKTGDARSHIVDIYWKELPDQLHKLHNCTYVIYTDYTNPPPGITLDGMITEFEPTTEQLETLLADGARDRRGNPD